MTRAFIDPDFEPGVAAWLEEDPNDAPPAVLNTVLAAFPSIPQRRASSRNWDSLRAWTSTAVTWP